MSRLKRLLIPGDLKVVSRRAKKGSVRSSVFLDLDGTIWPDVGPGTIFQKQPVERELLDCINDLARSGHIIIGYTNQTYFGYKANLSLRRLLLYRYYMKRLVRRRVFDAIFACHHHPDSNIRHLRRECEKRKPNVGLLTWASDTLGVVLENSYAIGDRITDVVAASQSGIKETFLIIGPQCLEWNKSKGPSKNKIITFQPSKNLKEALLKIKWSDFC